MRERERGGMKGEGEKEKRERKMDGVRRGER